MPGSSFLETIAYRQGEFEQQSTITRSLTRSLSTRLEQYIRDSVVNESAEAMDVFVADAFSVVRGMLSSEADVQALEAEGEEARKKLTKVMKAKLAEYSVSPDELDAVVTEASSQLAQLILGRWLGRLSKRLGDSPSIELTKDMLPFGDDVAGHVLGELDLDEFAVSHRDVGQAFAAFRQELTGKAIHNGKPIELGTRMFAVPDSRPESAGEYLLFSDTSAAEKFAQDDHVVVGHSRPDWERLRTAFAEAYGLICQAAANRPAPRVDPQYFKPLIACARIVGGKSTGEAQSSNWPNKEFSRIVETTIGAMVRGNLAGPDRARKYLCNEIEGYAGRLRGFANASGASVEDACVLYGTSVAAVIDAQTEKPAQEPRAAPDALRDLLAHDNKTAQAEALVATAAMGVFRGMQSIEECRGG